jgi:hypothetical protein
MTKITLNQARHLALRAQGLIERYPDPLAAMKAVVAVQSQYSVSLLPALYARAEGVTARNLEKLLKKDRSLIKSWNLRHTLHCFRTQDMLLFRVSLGEALYRKFRAWMDQNELFENMEMADLENGIMDALADGPLAREEIHSRVPALQELPHAGWGADVKGLAYKGDLVMCEQGASRSQFARQDHWVPGAFGEDAPPDPAADLFRRYLLGHGLATLVDFRYWVGVTGFDVKSVHARIAGELHEVDVEGRRCVSLLDPADLPDEPPKACRFLAKFDPLVMGWKDKSLFLEPKHFDKVIRPAGQIEATLLLDGQIVATWRLERNGKKAVITIFPFRKLAKKHHGRIIREGRALLKAHGYKEREVVGLTA